jgi:Mg2+ and Co2+ transporter CorA
VESGARSELARAPMDSSMSAPSIVNATLSAKVSEKRAEQGLDLLKNRIRLLRQEEAKAKAKVAETKRRQDEIIALRARNEEAAARRAEHRLAEEDRARRQREERLAQKHESRVAVKQTFDKMYSERREQAMQTRKEEAENQRALRTLRETEVAKAQRRREQILGQQRKLQSDLGRQRQAHQQDLIQNFLGMIADEEARRAQIEAEIAEMEQDELAQIEKLRELQEEQRVSYDALEFALAQ